MAHSGRSRQRATQGGSARSKRVPGKHTPKHETGRRSQKPTPSKAAPPTEPRVFRLGAVAGATPGRWIDTWNKRMPHVPLELIPLDARTQRSSIDEVDAALVRLPLADEGLHVIALYDEVPVVVASVESHLMAVDEVTGDDLAGEVLITPLDDVLGPLGLATVEPRFAAVETTADAVATAATGVGIVVVPLSLARLHQRKDVDYRPLVAGPTSSVALAWARERTTEDVETFIGIVRGRTANSSR